MPSQLLFATSCLRASYKAAQNVLHLDWYGSLTLSAVQVASAQVAHLGLVRCYPRVLICTEQVRTVSHDVTRWLAHNVLPGLGLVGASQVAWVYQASLEGAALARYFGAGVTLTTRLFTDAKAAIAWLDNQPSEPVTSPRPTSEVDRLRRIICVFQRKTLVTLARHPLWLLAEPMAASSNLMAVACVQETAYSALEIIAARR